MELVAYFDASGSPEDPGCHVLTVAGFMTSVEKWRDFDAEWSAMLATEQITCLHMKEFAHSVGEFRSWKRDETRRRGLMAGASQIIGKHAMETFSVAILLDDYRRADTEYTFSEFCKPYTIAAGIAVSRVQKRIAQSYSGHSFSCVFEKGDIDQDQLVKFLQIDGSEGPVQFLDKAHTPLQAADFLSYEHTKNLTDVMSGKRRKVRESLFSLTAATGNINKPMTALGYPFFSLMAKTFKLARRGSNQPQATVLEVADVMRKRRERKQTP